MSQPARATTADVRTYWNQHIHDLEITSHPVGSPGFFADLDQYHFEKLHHLLRLVDFAGYKGKRVLEVGCGDGRLTRRYAAEAAAVTAIDPDANAIGEARVALSDLRVSLYATGFDQYIAPPGSYDVVILSWSL